jgi:SOS-response transcriptional repressor LexA
VVYVNGYEATLKRVNKEPGGIVLQPLNPSYSPRFYSYDDARHPVAILGIVVEIRRRVN